MVLLGSRIKSHFNKINRFDFGQGEVKIRLLTIWRADIFVVFILKIFFDIFKQIHFSDKCSNDASCEANDANKQCSSGNCVCKTGYYSDVAGVCVQGKGQKKIIPNFYFLIKKLFIYQKRLTRVSPHKLPKALEPDGRSNTSCLFDLFIHFLDFS